MNKLLRHLHYGVAGIVFTLFLTACGSGKNVIYFQNTHPGAVPSYQDVAIPEIRIMPNDNLLITVSTPKNPLASEPYNLISNNARSYAATLELYGYLVDERGDINFPELGRIHVAGLTKSELMHLLQSKLSQSIINPVVNIRLMNFKVSVLGEVARPGSYAVDNERISLPDALAKAGDMTIFGSRRNVFVYREENGEQKIFRVDMTSPRVFSHEAYYLQQNDVVYVEPNKSRVQASNVNPMLGTYLSITGLLLTSANIVVSVLLKRK